MKITVSEATRRHCIGICFKQSNGTPEDAYRHYMLMNGFDIREGIIANPATLRDFQEANLS